MSPTPQSAPPNQTVRIAFALVALVSILAGLLLYLFASRLGFDEDLAEIIAIVFLLAGIGDYVVLYFWDRIFKGRSR